MHSTCAPVPSQKTSVQFGQSWIAAGEILLPGLEDLWRSLPTQTPLWFRWPHLNIAQKGSQEMSDQCLQRSHDLQAEVDTRQQHSVSSGCPLTPHHWPGPPCSVLRDQTPAWSMAMWAPSPLTHNWSLVSPATMYSAIAGIIWGGGGWHKRTKVSLELWDTPGKKKSQAGALWKISKLGCKAGLGRATGHNNQKKKSHSTPLYV